MFLDSQTLIKESEQSEASLEKIYAEREGILSIRDLRLSWMFIRKSDMVLLDVPHLEAAPVVLTKHFHEDEDMDFRLYMYRVYIDSPYPWLITGSWLLVAMKASEAFSGWKTRNALQWLRG